MKSACLVCGADYIEDFTFCLKCGTRLRQINANKESNSVKSDNSSSFNTTSIEYYASVPLKDLIKTDKRSLMIYGRALFIFALIISIGIISFMWGFMWFLEEIRPGPYEYIETEEFYFDDDISLTDLYLEISNTHSVSLSIEPNLDYYFYAKIHVFARDSSRWSWYNESDEPFYQRINESELILAFEDFWRAAKDEIYELEITISSKLASDLVINDIKGDIILSTNSAQIDNCILETFGGGDITVLCMNTLFTGFKDSSLSYLQEGVEFRTFDSSGDLKATFINSTFLLNNYMFYSERSGSIEATFVNSIFMSNNTEFGLEDYSSEGDVNLQIKQEMKEYNSSHNVTYNLHSDQSSVYCTNKFSSEIGVGFDVYPIAENIITSGFPSSPSFPCYNDNYGVSYSNFFFDLFSWKNVTIDCL